jgi:hypothetical protein
MTHQYKKSQEPHMTLEEQIEARKQQAAERHIFEKANLIAEQLGKEKSSTTGVGTPLGDIETQTITRAFNDASSSLVVRQLQKIEHDEFRSYENVSNEISITFDGKEVFRAGNATYVGGSKKSLEGYAPGVWEKILDGAYSTANESIKKELAAAAQKKAAEEAATRQKWGLR